MGITQLANKPKIECDSRGDAVTDTQKLSNQYDFG